MKSVLKIFKKVWTLIKRKWNEIKKHQESELEAIEKIDKAAQKLAAKTKESEWIYNWKFIFSFWLTWALVIYISYLVFQSLSLIYLIFAAFIISIAVESVIEFFQKKMHRAVAIFLTYILLLAFIISWFILVVPFILNQSAEILKLSINEINTFQDTLQQHGLEYMIKNTQMLPWYIKKSLISYIQDPQVVLAIQDALQKNISQIVSIWNTFIKNVWYFVVNIITSFFSWLFQIILVFVLSFFFSLEKDWVIAFFDKIWDKQWLVSLKLKKVYKKLGFWLKGQLLLSLYIWFVVWVVLETLSFPWIWIDLPNKFSLAIIAWITEFVPMLGPILWAIPAALVAILAFWLKWLIVVLIAYYIIQWTENNILVPFVMNQALWVSPLLIFIAMLIWWSVLWFVWIVLSVPLAVILTIIFEDINQD